MSTTFHLFGQSFELSQDLSLNLAQLPGPDGDYPCQLELSLISEAESLATIVLKGQLPSTYVELEADFHFRIENNRLIPMDVRTTRPGSRVVYLLHSVSQTDSQNPVTRNPSMTVARDGADQMTGFTVIDEEDTLKAWVEQADKTIENLDLASSSWMRTEFSFDLKRARVRAKAPGAGMTIIDSLYSEEEDEEIFRSQRADASDIIIDASGVHIYGTPINGAFMLHPDVFDTRAIHRGNSRAEGPATNPEDNAILYQYALVNGRLDWTVLKGADRVTQIRWVGHEGDDASDPGMVIFRYQDEHGNPLIIRPVGSDGLRANLRLGYRHGLDTTVAEDDSETSWEKSNRGIVVTGRASEDGDFDAAVPCILSSLDPVALYSRADDDYDPIDGPRWLIDGVAPYSKRAPLEIHGMITGARMRCKTNFIKQLWEQGALGHEASLNFREVVDPVLQEVDFYRSELLLGKAEHWELQSQTEERDVYQKVAAAPNDLLIRGRAATATANEIRLPLIDTKFAFANLTGVDRRHAQTGLRLGKGRLAREGRDWSVELNEQFAGESPSAFSRPKIGNYTHVTGFGARPSDDQPYETIIEVPPVTARALKESGTQSVGLIASTAPPEGGAVGAAAVAQFERSSEFTFSTDYMFGGLRTPEQIAELEGMLENLGAGAGSVREKFFQLWNDPSPLSPAAREGIKVLREILVGLREFDVEPADEEQRIAAHVFYQQKLASVIEELTAGKEVPGIPFEENDFYLEFFQRMTPEEFGEYWKNTAPYSSLLEHLWDYFWAPPSNELFRRALSLLFPELRSPGADPSIDEKIQPYLDALRAEVLPFDVNAWKDIFKGTLQGFLTDLEQGADVLYREAVRAWKDLADEQLDALREEFGSYLTEDVYKSLLANKEAANQFLAILKEKNRVIQEYAGTLKDLADLKSATRNYLFFTSKFDTKEYSTAKRLLQSKNTKFNLCQLGKSTNWFFLIDEDTTVVVKITRDRSLPDILREIEAEYRTDDRPNPLGVVLDGALPSGKTPVDMLVERLQVDLLQSDWVGVLLISPTADIGEDKTLRDLAGFEHLKAAYVAIGGRKPQWQAPGSSTPPISVTANIFKEDPNPRDGKETTNTAEGWTGDTKLALVKFDVTIKDTKVDQGEIIFQLNLQNLLGRSWDKEEDPEQPEIIYVRGDLPKSDSADKDGEPRSFEFGAWFDKPYKAEIDIAFLRRAELAAVTVGQHLGRTAINIDGALVLQQMEDVPGFEMEFKGDVDEMAIELTDFRILLPLFKGGFKREFGTFLPLNFNFPSVRFALPKPRAFNIWGIEFLPQALGFIRGVRKEVNRLKNEFTWLNDLDFDGVNKTIPFMELSVDFGKLPEFGGSNLEGLKFKLGLAIDWNLEQRRIDKVALGIAGLEAKEIRIEFFRLMSLALHEFRLGKFDSKKNPDSDHSPTEQVTGLVVGDLDFKILDWEPLGEDEQLELMFLQPNDKNNSNRGMLAHFSSKERSKDFFRLFWLLIGHNLNLNKDILTHLLYDQDVMGHDTLLDQLIEERPGNNDLINAAVTSSEEWLLGASFALGDILDECSFVFQDGRYYGIRLSAFWVPPIFQQRSIELAYIPGTAPNSDRFRTNLRLPFLDYLGVIRSGEFALEWSPNWDFLIDIGYPWNVGNGPNWFRAFAAGNGIECKIGWFIDKRTGLLPVRNNSGQEGRSLTVSAGFGYYLGYFLGSGNSVAYVRAGIGVFAILQGSVTLENANGTNPFKGSIARLEVKGVIGIFAYGEGGINVWVLSASFRVAAVAAVTSVIVYVRNAPCMLKYSSDMYAYYSASCRVGSGPFKWTFRVSGRVGMGVSGQLLLN